MAQGLSKESFAGDIGVHKDTIYEWADRHKAFSDAIKRGEGKSRIFWEKMGNAGALGRLPGFNSASWIFNMKNRFGWRDKQEITGEDGGALVVQVVKHADNQDSS